MGVGMRELGSKVDLVHVGRGVTRNDRGVEVTRGELGVEGIPGKVCRGHADKVTNLEDGLAMHGGSMALGTLGSIMCEAATCQVKALGMVLAEVIFSGLRARRGKRRLSRRPVQGAQR
jgi:hypothetical protein